MTPIEAPLPPLCVEVGSVDPDVSPFVVLDRGRYHRTWMRDTSGALWRRATGSYRCSDSRVKGWL